MAALMLPSAVLTHLKVGVRAALGPDPVLMTWCAHPASATLPKHCRPSLTTEQLGSRLRLANPEIDVAQKLATRRNFRRTGFPSGVVSTAAMNGVLPGAPRPLLPPPLTAGAFAADVGVVDLDPTGQALAGITLQHDLLQLVFDVPGRGLPHSEATAQFDAGDALLALGQVIDGTKPYPQRQVG